MNFLERAAATVSKGVPVIRLRPRTKIAMDNDWPQLATTDLTVLEKWNQETPDANVAAVAKNIPGGVFFLEIDDPSVITRIETETGHKIPKTYRVRSRPGRGHYYFRQTSESIELGNLAQGYVKNADFSVRVENQYVVAANSTHPLSGLPYEIVSTADISDAPSWLIDWLRLQKVDKADVKKSVLQSTGLVKHGLIHSYMLTEAGKLRAMGLEVDEIETVLLRKVHENCEPPLDDEKIKAMARSVGKYEVKNNIVLVGTGQEDIPVEELEEKPEFAVPPYPKFPRWVFDGTSLYNGFVRPFCEKNSRYEEFLFMPAVALYLNYLSTRVKIQGKDFPLSLYMVLIGRKGRIIKSSSVKDAMRYFTFMGLLEQSGPAIRNAEGKIIVFTAGSPEGLGIEAQRINSKNFVLFYDELSVLTNKAGIESSTLVPNLLTLYEGDRFSNMVKSRKETYSLDPGTYCASLIACCTDKNFKSLWGRMSGVTTGLNDRFFFLYQPENFKPVVPPISVNTAEGAIETRKLIDKAVQQGVYKITDSSPLADRMSGENALENRQEIRAEKLALYFSVDLGYDEITEDCLERALAIIEYERAVKKKLRASESITREASIQNEIVDFLISQPAGMATYREIRRNLHPERVGTSLWTQAFTGLMKVKQIKIQGTGKKGDPEVVVLLEAPEEIDE
jgi:hypothetical protein